MAAYFFKIEIWSCGVSFYRFSWPLNSNLTSKSILGRPRGFIDSAIYIKLLKWFFYNEIWSRGVSFYRFLWSLNSNLALISLLEGPRNFIDSAIYTKLKIKFFFIKYDQVGYRFIGFYGQRKSKKIYKLYNSIIWEIKFIYSILICSLTIRIDCACLLFRVRRK